MEMFQYSEKKVRMGWHSPALCAVSSSLSFTVGSTLPSASTGPPAASWRIRPLWQCHHKDPWGRTPAPSLFSALLLPLLCGTMFTQPLHRESRPEPTSTNTLSCPPRSPFYLQRGEPWRTGHLSLSGGNEEPGEVELHEIQAGSICQDASASRIAVTPLLRAVAVGGHLGLSVREGFIY